MSEILKQQIFVMLKNTARIITFAVLGVIFNRWWIVLISPLFFVYVKDKKDE